jgi:DNA primase
VKFLAFLDEALIDEIKAANDIVDIIGEYVTLKRAGPSYKGLCPFHKEKTPSFSVSPDKQIFHCFGCGVGGDVIKFLMQTENIDFYEAVEQLAERAKITLPEDNTNVNFANIKHKERLFQVNLEAAKYFRNNLYSPAAKSAQEYINKRHLDNETVNKFGLGFSFGVKNDLFNHLSSLGFTPDEMVDSGLIIRNNNSFVDRFKNRLMFPIFDIKDRVIAFGGRVLDDSLPKYMNSPETPIYNKGKNIYALNFARRAKVNKLLMVEGYMDVISMHKAGIPNAIASLGTALTETQGRLMRKYAPEIILGYDADGAGQNAIMRGLDILTSLGCNVKVLKISDAKDPDEFVNKFGPEKMKKLMDNAITLVEFKLSNLKKNIDMSTTDGKISYLNSAATVLAKLDNSIERDFYINKIAAELGVGVESIYSEINKKIFGNSTKSVKRSPIPSLETATTKIIDIPKNVYDSEKLLIFLLCQNDKKIFNTIKKYMNYDNFTVNLYRHLAEKLYMHFESEKQQNIIDLFSDENDINVITGIMQEEDNLGNNNEKALLDAVDVLRKFDLEKEKSAILKSLKDDPNGPKANELERRLNDVILKLHSISAERRK